MKKNKIMKIGMLAVGLLGGVVLLDGQGEVSAATETWGPQDRPTYSWSKPSDKGPVFNSITDNPGIKDERNFVRVRKADTKDNYVDNLNVEVGAEYEVYVYYHNNASASLNDSGKGIANNVRLKMEFPEVITNGQAAKVKGTISATYAEPESVWDTAYLHAKEIVYLRYVHDSAVIHNAGTANGSILDKGALFGKEGAKLAHFANSWGMIPGCNEYAGYVTFRIKVDKPGFYMEKTVSKQGENKYGEYITAKPGEVLDFKIRYKNTGTTDQMGVVAYDQMGKGLTAVKDTTYLKNPTKGGKEKESLFTGGLKIGDYRPDQEAVLTYKMKLSEDEKVFGCGDTVTYNNASVATANGTIHDKVKITVHRDCANTSQTTIPKTGPAEVALAIVIAIGVAGGGAYYLKTRKDLKKITDATTSGEGEGGELKELDKEKRDFEKSSENPKDERE